MKSVRISKGEPGAGDLCFPGDSNGQPRLQGTHHPPNPTYIRGLGAKVIWPRSHGSGLSWLCSWDTDPVPGPALGALRPPSVPTAALWGHAVTDRQEHWAQHADDSSEVTEQGRQSWVGDMSHLPALGAFVHRKRWERELHEKGALACFVPCFPAHRPEPAHSRCSVSVESRRVSHMEGTLSGGRSKIGSCDWASHSHCTSLIPGPESWSGLETARTVDPHTGVLDFLTIYQGP